jgi:hypothetical protein
MNPDVPASILARVKEIARQVEADLRTALNEVISEALLADPLVGPYLHERHRAREGAKIVAFKPKEPQC